MSGPISEERLGGRSPSEERFISAVANAEGGGLGRPTA